jgi:uncharacterized membrane protein YukC
MNILSLLTEESIKKALARNIIWCILLVLYIHIFMYKLCLAIYKHNNILFSQHSFLQA